MVRAGASWSGRERNCAFLNVEGDRFANVSGISGLDWMDDGRAVATCDWDQDGDLDLWFKNRTGPQCRLMKNEGPVGNFISLELDGSDCNKDAIGARVTVWASGRAQVQTVQAGSGYLSQCSKRLHFGLGKATKIERIEVRWPGGDTETLPPAKVGFHYRYLQGSGRMQSWPAHIAPALAGATNENSSDTQSAEIESRIVLRQPFPLPENWLDDDPEQDGGFELVTFWAQWCGPCRTELTQFGKQLDVLKQAGIRVKPLNLDSPADLENARTVAEGFGLAAPFHSLSESQSTLLIALLRSVLDIHEEIALPLSMLLDSEGNVVVIYNGPVSVDEVIRDRQALAADKPASPQTGTQNWVMAEDRRYHDVVDELKTAGLLDWARFYLKLDREAKGPR